jgi:hypothetical protein
MVDVQVGQFPDLVLRLGSGRRARIRAMSRRRLWATLTVVVLAVLGIATPAHAATTWQYNDGMGRLPSQYYFDYPAVASIQTAPGPTGAPILARSLPQSAELEAGYGQDWSSIYEYVHLTPAENGARPSCVFSAWTNSGMQTFNIEVIDPTTWAYIAVGNRAASTEWQWEQMATPTFRPASPDVVIRVSLISLHFYGVLAFVDDFNVTCTS